MLDVRLTGFVVPIAEQPLDSITPVVRVQNFADEDGTVTGQVRIYRETTGLMLYSSQLAVTLVLHASTANIAALTPWDPPAPADDYFIIAEIHAETYIPPDWHHCDSHLDAYHFDVKPVPAGPPPAGHHATHESGGMDEPVLTGMLGLLGTAQTPALHAVSHQDGQADEINVAGLHGELADDQPPLQHGLADPTKHTSAATPGQILQADANGLPVDASNTDAEVAAAVTASHADEICDTPQTLADGANIDWDLAIGGAAQVTLGGNRTLNAPTNMVNGARYRLKVIQDGTGTRLLTWNAVYRFPGGVDPCLTAAINRIDILIFDCDGTHMDCTGMVNALA